MTRIYRHTPDMCEISGFGGDYENCCQDMLEAGVKWLNTHAPHDIKVLEFPNIYGIIEKGTPDTEELSKVVINTAKGDVTAVMHHAVMARLAFIAANGWDKYCEKLRKE